MPTRSVISELAVNADTPRRLCAEIAGELESVCAWGDRTLRPWDDEAPDSCLWWALATPQWPSFHVAKLFVDWLHPHMRPDLFFGLHIEKGIEPVPGNISACSSTTVMDDDWAWRRLRQDLGTGAIDELVRSVSSRQAPKLYLRVEVGDSVDAASPHPHERTLWRHGVYCGFECNGDDATLKTLFAHDPDGVALPLSRSANLRELGAAMEEIPDASSRWIDLQLGLTARIWKPDSGPAAVSVQQLVERHVRPLAQWATTAAPCRAGSEDSA